MKKLFLGLLLATTLAFPASQNVGGGGGGSWGQILGTLADQTDLQAAIDLKANLASPALTGTTTSVGTPAVGTGTNVPTGNLTVKSSSTTFGNVTVSDGSAATDALLAYGTTTTRLRGYKAANTAASPSATSGAGGLIQVEGWGYEATNGFAVGPSLQLRHVSTWTNTSHESDAILNTIASGATSSTATFTASSNGSVILGASGNTNANTVNGPLKSSGGCNLANTVVAAGNTTGATSVDLSTGSMFTFTLTGNTTFSFSNEVAGCSYVFVITQDGTGSRTMTWPGGVVWLTSAGTAPAAGAASKILQVGLLTTAATAWNGTYAGNY